MQKCKKFMTLLVGLTIISSSTASAQNSTPQQPCSPVNSWNKLIEKNRGKNPKKLIKKIKSENNYSTFRLFLGNIVGVRTANNHDYIIAKNSQSGLEFFFVVNNRTSSLSNFRSVSLQGESLEVPMNGGYKSYKISENTTEQSFCSRQQTGFLACDADSEAIFKIDQELVDYMAQQPETPYIEARFKKADGTYASCPRYLYSGEFKLLKMAITPE